MLCHTIKQMQINISTALIPVREFVLYLGGVLCFVYKLFFYIKVRTLGNINVMHVCVTDRASGLSDQHRLKECNYSPAPDVKCSLLIIASYRLVRRTITDLELHQV